MRRNVAAGALLVGLFGWAPPSIGVADAAAPTEPAGGAPGATSVGALPTITQVSAFAMALEANPSFRATLFDAIAARAAAESASSARAPTFVTTTSGGYREALTPTGAGGVRTRDRTISNTMGLRYTTNVGTVLALDIVNTTLWREINRDNSSTALSLIGPTHTASATISARQPLIRGAGRDVVLATQHQADASEVRAESDAEVAASQLVVDVLTAYWELWYADRSLGIQSAAVELATRQRAEADQRVRLGTESPAGVLRFATEEASLHETWLTARTARAARAIELARLIGYAADGGESLATPEDPPELAVVPDLAQALETMVLRAPSLRSLEAQIDAARAQQVAATSASRPRLDVTGTLGTVGLWAHNDTLTGFQFPGGRPAIVGTVGLELELPLVSDIRAAQRAAAQAQLDAAESRRAAEVARLRASLATEFATLEATVGRAALAQATAQVAADLAEAERARLSLGTSTSTTVVQAQQTARESQLRVARALVDGVLSAARVAHATGVLLNRFGLVVPEEVSP